jgi:phage baseplate assembly protein W
MSKQFYDIKYPLTEESERLTFFDLNETFEDSVKSMVLHIILTPKGQRIRQPSFGTDLIKYIFEHNDEGTWNNIKDEIRKQISFYLPQVIFNNINVIQDEENKHDIYVEVDYSVENNGTITNNKTFVKI